MQVQSDELVRIRQRAERATKGPWVSHGGGFIETASSALSVIGVMCKTRLGSTMPLPAEENAEFIANARTDLPRLADEVERLHHALQMIADGKAANPIEFAAAVLDGASPDVLGEASPDALDDDEEGGPQDSETLTW